MIQVIGSGLLMLAGLYGIPVSFRLMDKRAAERRRRVELREQRLAALAARKAAKP